MSDCPEALKERIAQLEAELAVQGKLVEAIAQRRIILVFNFAIVPKYLYE